jgi:NADPH:quinone reductase-like Zn-dependent oxidoreductase
VTAVCSTANLGWVQALGADEVIDYTQEDVRMTNARFDLVFDAVGRMVSGYRGTDFRPILASGGTYVSVEMNRKDRVEDLQELKGLVEAGAVKPVIERCNPMAQIAQAHRYVELGHLKDNVVVRIGAPIAGPSPV